MNASELDCINERFDEIGERLDQIEERRKRFFGPTTRGFALSFVAFAILLYGTTLERRTDTLRACERTNGARVSQLHADRHLVQVNRGRVEAAVAEGDTETADANRVAITKYASDRDALIASSASSAIAPSQNRPNGVRIVCEDAYPKPWPLG